ncbi:hypothetical protein D8674_029608 [Pyrus ussuriensis x Pyrus communis]|uniref:Uncharacterized protein n=1 Tax=Pyrus ussuriensis x Pyrus communis TaxID=2448454 RepID=A0A5N5I4C0_9ROSA|nr:hypothetical protein D8674_029608 [Pyrus ussuriensis x Pyrus communis]
MQAAATGPLVSLSPSFNTYSSSDRLAQIAARVVDEFTHQDRQLTQEPYWESIYDHQEEEKLHHRRQPKNDDVQKDKEEEEEDEFEFAFVSSGGESHTSPISADEIFSNGQIKPTVYPLFNQDLLLAHNDVVSSTNANDDADDAVKKPKPRRLPLRMLMIEEERETASCSSSEADDLENLPPGTYCVWAPPKSCPGQRRCNKSSSAGSSSKRWKFRNLLHRSSSDDFVFLAPSSTKRANNKKGDDVTRKRVDNSCGGVSENGERYVVRSKAEEAGDKRRSFLPYKQDFVGFFSNVNGISRNLHPF